MTETLQIFISGTQDDLQPERQAVAEAIRALGHTPLMAETYGAQPMPSYDAIREMIARADIYLGVYGARYGWKMESGVSVTEFEFTEFRRTRPLTQHWTADVENPSQSKNRSSALQSKI